MLQKIDFQESEDLKTAVLLTGINQTDHNKQFEKLSIQINNNCHAITTVLQSRDCPNIKSAVEKLTAGLMKYHGSEDEAKLKKSQLTFQVLEAWYRDHHGKSQKKPSLVVMIADFEQFNSTCIQELIDIMCHYSQRLPFVLIVGIATSLKSLHNVLPPHITNKMSTSVFQAETSTVMLNKILEEVILTPHSPVQLSGKSLKILMDIFLFYDYSLHGFVKGYKVFMMEHFISRPVAPLVITMDDDNLTKEDFDTIRRTCLSFRDLVESKDPKEKIKLITDDNYLRKKLCDIVMTFKNYLFHFYCCLRILSALLEDLPKNDLGKLVRELYPICMSSNITNLDEYKECFKILRFSAKDKFLSKLDKVMLAVQVSLEDEKVSKMRKNKLEEVQKNLITHRKNISEAGMSPSKEAPKTSPKVKPMSEIKKSRHEIMMQLKVDAENKSSRTVTEYERHLWNCLDYLNSLMEMYLLPMQQAPPFFEFFMMHDCSSVRRQIVGAPRGALHNALNNPHHYLQCSCCRMTENEQLLPSMPDTCIAYKLHLESNKFINLYDWLQSFSIVVDSHEEDEQIAPEVQ